MERKSSSDEETLRQVRTWSYKLARFLGDAKAVLSGPQAMWKRFGRKRLLKAAGGGTILALPGAKRSGKRRRG